MAHGRLSLFGVGGWDRRCHPAQSQRSESVAVRLFRRGRRSSGTLMAASCTRTAIYAACRSYPLVDDFSMSLCSPREMSVSQPRSRTIHYFSGPPHTRFPFSSIPCESVYRGSTLCVTSVCRSATVNRVISAALSVLMVTANLNRS